MTTEDAPQDTVIDVEPQPGQPSDNTGLAIPTEVLPNTLIVLPVVERPFFPIQTVPVSLPERPWMESLQKVGEQAHHLVGMVMLKDGADPSSPKPEDFHEVGTAVRVHQAQRMPEAVQFIGEGLRRIRIVRWLTHEAPFTAQVEYAPESYDDGNPEIKAYAMAIMALIKELIPLNPLYSEQLKQFLDRFSPNQSTQLADFAANITTASGNDMQEVLELFDIRQRLERVLAMLRHELEVVKLHSQIREEVDQKMSEQQRRFFLQEQLKVIRKELGLSKDDQTADIDEFRARLEQLSLPEAAAQRVEDELQKLSVLETGSPEYAVTRNYLDWTTSLPWGRTSEDRLDLARARQVLDADHTGLDDVKERIIEFLAVGQLKGGVSGSILCLAGPPGVGKTSIGRSIANALGREFFRFSVGGMRDEAEIKGHRRTYIGAMPGKFVQALKEAGTQNPVIMLDEIDKIGRSYQGDPASALLEVLDPEQNGEFLDHYLDLRLDLSNVLFVCTANQLDTIAQPLLDRMELIRLAGYITEDKVSIARDHLLPRQLERNGLRKSQLKVSDAALRQIANGYAREAGVRNLEKQLGRIARKAAVEVVRDPRKRLSVGAHNLEAFLGKPIFQPDRAQREVGVVTGLAWTSMGGATLSIEASEVHTSQRGFKQTGQLGDVMRESAEIAYSYVVANLATLGGRPDFFERAFVHLHVPEGATPKDGPSAGITMATALLSLARGERTRIPVAMTGELTLSGKVLPVGGIREKVVAARRSGLKTLILPAANQRDVEELPDYLTRGITFHFAGRFDDVFAVVFGKA
ncbi:MAG: endopeptidase La [Pseudomonadota bacterium]